MRALSHIVWEAWSSGCLEAVWSVVGPGWPRRGRAGPRLQGGLLIAGEHQLIGLEGTGRASHQLGDGGGEAGVTGVLGVPPPMLPPGFQLMRGQHPPPRRGREVLHDPVGEELPRQCGTSPRREAAAQELGVLAGQAHDVERPPGPPHAGPGSVGPSGRPPGVGRRRPAPRGSAHGQRPATGSSAPAGPSRLSGWSTVATGPASDALRGPGPGVTKTCGHVPW